MHDSGDGPDDAGMVTVEAAIALGAVVLVTVLAVAAVAAVAASIRCTDAARELVRLAARGEPDRGLEIAARLAPGGAEIELRISGDEAVAQVSAIPSTLLPVRVAATAVGVLEPGAVATPSDAGPHAAGGR
ncbi:MAG: TadE family type IV pilus minor pilin [Pseudonocardia sp.]